MKTRTHALPPAAESQLGLWWNQRVRALLPQVLLLLVAASIIGFFAWHAVRNMGERRLNFGLDFLSREAGFGIGETWIAYSAQSSFGRAFLAGLLNTVSVSVLALLFTTVIGLVVGIGSVSANPVLRRLCLTYVALFRNIPLLLQLYLWYAIAIGLLPTPAQSWHGLGVHISRAGIFLPLPHWQASTASVIASVLTGGAVAWCVWRFVLERRIAVLSGLAIAVMALLAGVATLVIAGGVSFELPVWQRFRFEGGLKFSPEFSALLIGLAIYSGSFIAEIVRAGILSVPKGQKEAAHALGLSTGQTLRRIVIPQAARVIIPPLTSQYLNLVKNSSLGVAIGYPDLVSVGNTTLNITGRAIECVAIMMAVYLALSLTIAAVMNVYNQKMALRTR